MSDHSCWNCGWRASGGITLLGICWGHTKERGGAMEIQATKSRDGRYLADVGCKKWTDKKQDFDAIKDSLKPKITEEEI